MPDLNTTLHLDMLKHAKGQRILLLRILKAIKREIYGSVYGLEWGDPDLVPPLRFIRDRYLLPYIKADQCAVEIGPGGGRWTRYLLAFKKLYVVDYYSELLDEVKRRFPRPHVTFVKNNSVNLANMRRIVKAGAKVVIHYSDKTKIMAQLNDTFAENTPEKMRSMVLNAGFKICEEDVTSMWHSSIVRFTL